ncbi:MAG TPA: diaminopropionate ammonia-lyase [Longimicrobiales bacterium]|nr:diaminopropionate ammonia-lyase [Longimicrobiales bacterium]
MIHRLLTNGDVDEALAALASWPEYRATPLRRLSTGARRVGVAELLYKDESTRFAAGSFKATGAAYAVQRAVEEARMAGEPQPTLCCATDGNHGRAVAWAAARFGCQAVIYLPDHALAERERRIRALGARTVRVGGSYDAAVELARGDAEREGWVVVSDTSDRPDDVGVLRIMAGYAVIVEEILDALGDAPPPTHAFLQAGVGTMAAALVMQLGRRLGGAAPRVVLVEPEAAACVLRSLEANDAAAWIEGDLHTSMDCLAAGRVSAAAWPVLCEWVDGVIAIDDATCAAALAAAAGGGLGQPLDVGPSGIAGFAGLLAAGSSDAARAAFDLDGGSRVLVIGTEEALAGR